MHELETLEYNLQRERWSWRPLAFQGLLVALDVDFFCSGVCTNAEHIFILVMKGSVWGT